ncbi:hypothetical protein J4U42_24640, partial [Escherichia coli]
MILLAGKKMKTNYFTHRLFPSDGAVICEPLKTSFDNMIATNRNTATLANEYHVIQHVSGFAPIFPDTCYHLTHYWLAAVDIPVASDNPVHYADAIRYNAR